MSTSHQPEEQPSWLLDDQSSPDRQRAYVALDSGRRAYEQVADGEFGMSPQALSLESLSETTDQETARSISRAMGSLRALLFDGPQDVFNGQDTERRFLVEYVAVAAIRELGKYIEQILGRAVSHDPPKPSEVTDFLTAWMKNERSELLVNAMAKPPDVRVRWAGTTSESTAVSRWRNDLGDLERELTRSLRAATALERVEEAAEDATKSAIVARQAAGLTGAARLGDHFVTTAARETRLASQWTAFTIASIVAVVGLAALILKPAQTPDKQGFEALAHLAIVLPIIGLASYTARIARHHRMFARWSDTAAVQIESVAAFARQIPSVAAQEELILGLGRSVFSTPTFADDPKTEHVSAIPTEVVEALKAIAEKVPTPGKN